jgi:hypothetical protein
MSAMSAAGSGAESHVTEWISARSRGDFRIGMVFQALKKPGAETLWQNLPVFSGRVL